jgi:hypothetical protein
VNPTIATLLEKLSGKKTYACITVGLAYAVAIKLGFMTSDQTVWVTIGAATLAALRSGMKAPVVAKPSSILDPPSSAAASGPPPSTLDPRPSSGQ